MENSKILKDLNFIGWLDNVELYTMLRNLGVYRIPSRMTDRRSRLTEYANQNNEAADRVINAYHILKGESAIPTSAMSAEEITKLIQKHLEKNAKQTVEKQIGEAVDEIKKELQTYRPIEVKGVVKSKKSKDFTHEVFERIVQLSSQRVNVMMVGPSGCGKTYISKQIADALDLPFSSISCSGGMSESQLAGWLLPVGTGGSFDYVPAPFVTMYENGGCFLFDEIDSADPNTLTFMNKAIANDGFFVPQRFKKPFIKKHANFAGLAAANTFGSGADSMYVGRNQLDAATLDRFRVGMIVMDYDKKLEEHLINSKVLEWGWEIREKINSSKLRKIMSTRTMIDLTTMVEAYKWKQEDWAKSYFADWSTDELRKVGMENYSNK